MEKSRSHRGDSPTRTTARCYRNTCALPKGRGGHTHHILPAAFAMHDTYRRKGDMRLTDWSEYIVD